MGLWFVVVWLSNGRNPLAPCIPVGSRTVGRRGIETLGSFFHPRVFTFQGRRQVVAIVKSMESRVPSLGQLRRPAPLTWQWQSGHKIRTAKSSGNCGKGPSRLFRFIDASLVHFILHSIDNDMLKCIDESKLESHCPLFSALWFLVLRFHHSRQVRQQEGMESPLAPFMPVWGSRTVYDDDG